MRFLFIFFLSSSAYAFDTCCVDEDIAAAFLLHQSYSRDWPTDFPLSVDIEGFEFIGSSKYKHSRHQSVAWRTDMEPQSARGVVIEAILANKWTTMPDIDQARNLSERGFIPHQRRTFEDNQQFCRDRDGILNVQARQSEIGTVVTLTHSDDSRSPNCAAAIAERGNRRGHQSGVMEYLPALMLPESIESNQGSGGGGHGNEAHSSMEVRTDVPAADVSFYFEPQMQSQQWNLETAFQGRKTSGHIWRRNVDGLDLACIVTVMENRDGLHLRMIVQAF